jgi:hypothetical protein
MWHVWGRGVVNVEFWWGNMEIRDTLEDLGMDGWVI